MSNKLYHTQQWRRRARQHLDQEPLCRACRSFGVITAAHVADHIAPCGDDAEAFWFGELQSLCHQCHQAKRQAEKHGRAWQQPAPRGCTSDGTPRDPSHHWNRR